MNLFRNFAMLFQAAVLMASAGVSSAAHDLPLPPRPSDAPTGSRIHLMMNDMNTTDCERFVYSQFRKGNVPDFLRHLKPVSWTDHVGGTTCSVTIYVAPDYVSLGSNADFFRMPVSAPLAQALADSVGCLLPTRKMVNHIYRAAGVKLAPVPFSPTVYRIGTPDVFWLSQLAIEDEFSTSGGSRPGIVAGIKKDIVLTPQLQERPAPARVAIYGWHRLDGHPIQPLALVHKYWYRDYSHGVRLVWGKMKLDGKTTDTASVLQDPAWNAALSDEGPTPASWDVVRKRFPNLPKFGK